MNFEYHCNSHRKKNYSHKFSCSKLAISNNNKNNNIIKTFSPFFPIVDEVGSVEIRIETSLVKLSLKFHRHLKFSNLSSDMELEWSWRLESSTPILFYILSNNENKMLKCTNQYINIC